MTVTNSDLLCEDGSYLNTESDNRLLLFISADDSGSLSFSGSLDGHAIHFYLQSLSGSASFSGNVNSVFWSQLLRNELLCEDGSYLNTESDLRLFLGFGYPYSDSGSLSFHGSLATIKIIARIVLSAVLSFSGFFARFPKKRIASGLLLTSVLKKKSSRLFTSALSFVGNAIVSRVVASPVLSGALSFVGNINFLTSKNLASVLSWLGDLVSKFNNTFFKNLPASISFIGSVTRIRFIQKLLTGTLRFIGSVNILPSFISVLLQSVLGFTTSIKKRLRFGNLVALFNVMITSVGQTILGISREDHRPTTVFDTIQTISNTPTPLDIDLSAQLSSLFIKNLDQQATIEVDYSMAFDKFPQLITPQSGIYLVPDAIFSSLYAQSSAPNSDIQIISSLRRS